MRCATNSRRNNFSHKAGGEPGAPARPPRNWTGERPSLHRLTRAFRVLAIRVISLSRLHSKVFALHLQLDMMIAGGCAVFVGCITHAVLGSQLLDNTGINFAHG